MQLAESVALHSDRVEYAVISLSRVRPTVDTPWSHTVLFFAVVPLRPLSLVKTGFAQTCTLQEESAQCKKGGSMRFGFMDHVPCASWQSGGQRYHDIRICRKFSPQGLSAMLLN